MRNAIVSCLVGAILGAVVMFFSYSMWHPDSTNRVDNEGRGAVADTATATMLSPDDGRPTPANPAEGRAHSPGQKSGLESDNATGQTITAGALIDASASSPIDQSGREIPDSYVAMVTPRPLPERLTTQEMYKEFSTEPRDEAWAYSMELGINQYIAERGGDFGAAFEFVECRSRYCTIAGVVYGGGQPTVNEFMSEMIGRGWWQAYGGSNTVGSRTGDEYRFVSIYPRTQEDFSRESSGQSIGKNIDSAVNSVGG